MINVNKSNYKSLDFLDCKIDKEKMHYCILMQIFMYSTQPLFILNVINVKFNVYVHVKVINVKW